MKYLDGIVGQVLTWAVGLLLAWAVTSMPRLKSAIRVYPFAAAVVVSTVVAGAMGVLSLWQLERRVAELNESINAAKKEALDAVSAAKTEAADSISALRTETNASVFQEVTNLGKRSSDLYLQLAGELTETKEFLAKWGSSDDSPGAKKCQNGWYAVGILLSTQSGGAHGSVYDASVVCRPLNLSR